MKNKKETVAAILSWAFAAVCLLMAIGVGFGSGCIMFLVTAAISLPIAPIRSLWDKILGIRPIAKADDGELRDKPQKYGASRQKSKLQKPFLIALAFIIAVCLGMSQTEDTDSPALYESSDGIIASEIQDTPGTEDSVYTVETEGSAEVSVQTPAENKPEQAAPSDANKPQLSSPADEAFSLSGVPEFSGTPYVAVNNNNPYFTADQLTGDSFEYYSPLDSLGRCGVAIACVGIDLMPTQERGTIGSVKPTGWHTVKYDCVDGKYLYNRCHLIGFRLSGENANTKNLITGTRYMNVDGMLPFENMVADYVKETKNHVMYRVTPIFEGDNLLASGVLMEAYSVEDDGDGICFNVFCYNVQPGITINYADGSGSEDAAAETAPPAAAEKPAELKQDNIGTAYILNTNTHKFHYPHCGSASRISDKNRQEYTGSRDDLIANGYAPCKNCNP